MMPFMGPLSHNPHHLLKLTAFSKSKGTNEQLRELTNIKKEHDKCLARVRDLERSSGSDEDKREIQRLSDAIVSLNATWTDRVKKMEDEHNKRLQEWTANSSNGEWEEKYRELLEKYNNEKSRLNNLRQLQNSSSDNSNEPVDPDLIQQEVDSCMRSKKEIEKQYTKQVRDLMIEISRLKASGGAPRTVAPRGDNLGGSLELDACLASKKDLEDRLLLLTNGDKSNEHLNIYIKKYGVLTPSDFIDTNTIEAVSYTHLTLPTILLV